MLSSTLTPETNHLTMSRPSSASFLLIYLRAQLVDMAILQTISFQLDSIPGQSQPHNAKLSISQPRIEQQGSRSVAYWSALGDASQVHGFQLDIKTDQDQWKETGGVLRSEPSQSHFRQALGALPVASRYFVRIRAVDGTSNTLATSSAASFSVKCQSEFMFIYSFALGLV